MGLSQHAGSPLVMRAVQTYLRSSLRGRTRVTVLLARYSRTLQAVPIDFRNGPTVYMDLRMPGAHFWFSGSPWLESPRERNEQQIMRRVLRAGDLAFDVGANLGLHMALLSRCVGPSGCVHAFEPNPQLYDTLLCTANGAGNCFVHVDALSDVTDKGTLFVPQNHSMASLADWTNGRHGSTRPVPCRQAELDRLIAEGLPRPDFMKCDVEGAELKVFRGARDMLARSSAPTILFEAGENTSRGFGLSKWAAMDFLATLERPRFSFFEVGAAAGDLRVVHRNTAGNLNILAVPESRRERLAGG